jgi:transcriptional regulator with XRE-family HTH domain
VALITGRQLRSARALVDLTLRDVARMTGLTVDTVARSERSGGLSLRTSTLAKLESVYVGRGVYFTPGGGVEPRHYDHSQHGYYQTGSTALAAAPAE